MPEQHVDPLDEFCDMVESLGDAAVDLELDDYLYVADLIECACAKFHDCDLEDAEDLRPTSDEKPIPDLIRSALGLLRQGLLTGDDAFVAVGYVVLEKAVLRLDRQAEEESGPDPHPSE